MQKKPIFLIILILISGFIGYEYMLAKENNIISGDTNILVLCVDPSETRPGMGGIDALIVLNITDGQISNIKPIFTGYMYHPTVRPSLSLIQHLIGCNVEPRYYLHDCLWESDTAAGAKLAQETLEYNMSIKTSFVIIITPEAVNAIIKAVGPIQVSGQEYISGNSIDLIRNDQYNKNISRVQAVKSLANSIYTASNDNSNQLSLINALLIEYVKGNIVIVPWDSPIQFIIGKLSDEIKSYILLLNSMIISK